MLARDGVGLCLGLRTVSHQCPEIIKGRPPGGVGAKTSDFAAIDAALPGALVWPIECGTRRVPGPFGHTLSAYNG